MNLKKNLIKDIETNHKAVMALLKSHPEKANRIFELSSWLLLMKEEIENTQKSLLEN